jgi:hypothetical protein
MKVLEIDIETAPTIGYVWGLFNQNVGLDQIVQPGYTLCFAAKWQGKKEVIFRSLWGDGAGEMTHAAWNLLDEADAVVHYNGKKFDVPTLNRDFVLDKLVPPASYQEIDLYQTVKRRFRFASNKLDFVCQQLGLGNKVRHKGMNLWKGVMAGNERDCAIMERYNKQDIRLLGRLYTHIQPWILQHPNRGLYVNSAKPVCRNCGSTDVVKNGVEARFVLKYYKLKCTSCGANLRSRFSTDSDKTSGVTI